MITKKNKEKKNNNRPPAKNGLQKKSEKMSMNSSINRKNVYYVDLGEDHISSNIVVWCYRIVNKLMY